MVDDFISLEGPGPPAVTSFPAADLAPPRVVDGPGVACLEKPIELLIDGGDRQILAVLAGPGLRRPDDPGRTMGHPGRVHMLVAVLASGAGTREERDLVILGFAFAVGRADACLRGGDDRDSDCRAMDPSLGFGDRYALDAVAAGFVSEQVDPGAGQFDRQALMSRAQVRDGGRPDLSIVAIGVAEIGRSQFGNEEPTVGAAFCGTDFERDRVGHNTNPSRAQSSNGSISGSLEEPSYRGPCGYWLMIGVLQ